MNRLQRLAPVMFRVRFIAANSATLRSERGENPERFRRPRQRSVVGFRRVEIERNIVHSPEYVIGTIAYRTKRIARAGTGLPAIEKRQVNVKDRVLRLFKELPHHATDILIGRAMRGQ